MLRYGDAKPSRGQQRRAQDVDTVYFGHARCTDPDAGDPARGATPEHAVAGLALFDGQHL